MNQRIYTVRVAGEGMEIEIEIEKICSPFLSSSLVHSLHASRAPRDHDARADKHAVTLGSV